MSGVCFRSYGGTYHLCALGEVETKATVLSDGSLADVGPAVEGAHLRDVS